MGIRATAVVRPALVTTGCAPAEHTPVTSTAERCPSAAGEGVYILITVWLIQHGSPQSTKVGDPHSETASSG
ncbi:hypothetical protein [Microbispora bryophytorum]|uniref:hypothetical protein n=1 Tax=Microbispora bryophytorum TaxID=1460882 RepID=UPI0033F5F5D2